MESHTSLHLKGTLERELENGDGGFWLREFRVLQLMLHALWQRYNSYNIVAMTPLSFNFLGTWVPIESILLHDLSPSPLFLRS